MKIIAFLTLGLGQHKNRLAGFVAVRDVLSTAGKGQKQWVGIGRSQFDDEDDEDIVNCVWI